MVASAALLMLHSGQAVDILWFFSAFAVALDISYRHLSDSGSELFLQGNLPLWALGLGGLVLNSIDGGSS